jgi:hypothetical protein
MYDEMRAKFEDWCHNVSFLTTINKDGTYCHVEDFWFAWQRAWEVAYEQGRADTYEGGL